MGSYSIESDTNKESLRLTWDPTLFQHSSCHCRMTAVMRFTTIPRQQGNLRLTHFQCSQYTCKRNQENVTSIHAADSVTFDEIVRISKYTVLRFSNVLHLHQSVCHKIGDTMVRTSRFTCGFVSGVHCIPSRTVCTERTYAHPQWARLLSRYSVLKFAVRPNRIERSLKRTSDLLRTYPSRFARDLALIPCWYSPPVEAFTGTWPPLCTLQLIRVLWTSAFLPWKATPYPYSAAPCTRKPPRSGCCPVATVVRLRYRANPCIQRKCRIRRTLCHMSISTNLRDLGAVI